ncbi:DUF6179 domain-containing protein [Thomasclavelia sp.]
MHMIKLGDSDNIFDYFDNLLSNLNQTDLIRVKVELMELLEIKMGQFTGGNSSVSKERGQALMDANIYLIGLYLKQFEIIKSIECLRTVAIKEIYNQGCRLLKELLHYSKIEVEQFLKELMKIDLYVYHDTLYRGLPLFFTSYNFDYNPQDTILTFDYPTYKQLSNKQGIERFLEYFKLVQLENSFYKLFSVDQITKMLFYYHPDYQALIFNVTKLLLKQLILKQLIKRSFSYLYLTKNELDKIIRKFDSSKNIESLIYEAFDELIISLHLEYQLCNYLQTGLKEITVELKSNYKLKKLESELAVAI